MGETSQGYALRQPWSIEPAGAPIGSYFSRRSQCIRDHAVGDKGDPDKGETMTVVDYRTRDGLADYGFSIEFQLGVGWRVYIIFYPCRHDHDDSPKLPYQSISDDGRRYVNWPSKLDSVGEAKTVAGLWAELVERYLRIQQENALYVELIERYRETRERRKAPLSNQDHLGDAVNTETRDPEQHDRDPTIPVPRSRQNC